MLSRLLMLAAVTLAAMGTLLYLGTFGGYPKPWLLPAALTSAFAAVLVRWLGN